MATRIGLAQRNGREGQRVATRSGIAQQLNGREWQRVAIRTGLAQLNGFEGQRVATSSGRALKFWPERPGKGL